MTRSAWVGGALGLFLLVLLTMPRHYRPWLVAAAVLGSAALVATQWANLVEFKRDKYASRGRYGPVGRTSPRAGPDRLGDVPRPAAGRLRAGALPRRTSQLPLESQRRSSAGTWTRHRAAQHLAVAVDRDRADRGRAVRAADDRLAATAWRLWRSDDAPLWMRQQGLLFLVLAANYLANGMFQDMTIIPMVHMILSSWPA